MLDKGSFSHQTHLSTTRAQQIIPSPTLIVQDEEALSFKEDIEISFNPVALRNRFERLESRIRRSGKEEEVKKTDKGDEIDFSIQEVQEISEQFEQKNQELSARALVSLRSRISKYDSHDEILDKILEAYPDLSLADEALDFLIRTAEPSLAGKLMQIKENLNQMHAREIKAGKNIMEEAQAFSKQNLGTPTSLRDLYRDLTGNPREPSVLFAELANIYTYEKMKTVISFILHALGHDLKSKGPSIERGELHRLLTEARSLQAILGVYRFFQGRMRLISTLFEQHGLVIPPRISFENLAKAFMKLVLEKYPSIDKVLQLGVQLGLQEELIAQVIIYSQMRDAIRQIATRLYRSEQHRQDLLATLLDTLDDLEDKLEEEEEEEEDDESL